MYIGPLERSGALKEGQGFPSLMMLEARMDVICFHMLFRDGGQAWVLRRDGISDPHAHSRPHNVFGIWDMPELTPTNPDL